MTDSILRFFNYLFFFFIGFLNLSAFCQDRTISFDLDTQTQMQRQIWLSGPVESIEIEAKLIKELRESPYKNHEILGQGSSKPWKVELMNGLVGVFKFKESVDNIHAYEAERIAYEIDRLFGFDIVPITILRKINGRLGSFQLYYKAETALTQWPNLMKKTIDIFDHLLRNTDRHAENYLIDKDRSIAIDNDQILSRSRDNYMDTLYVNWNLYQYNFGEELIHNLKNNKIKRKALEVLRSFNLKEIDIFQFKNRLEKILN